MNLGEMIKAIARRIDDSVDNADAVEWLNAGKNKMAVAIGADFPDIQLTTDLSDTFVFPAKYHLGPVEYAAAKAKEKDSSVNEAGNFMSQFEQIKRDFVQTYEVPAQYRDDRLSQQFTATDGQDMFLITKEGYNPSYGDLKVYKNGLVQTNFTTNDDKTFILSSACVAGDKITALWEEHIDLIEPPYKWFGAW
jgi:hypothetical protein